VAANARGDARGFKTIRRAFVFGDGGGGADAFDRLVRSGREGEDEGGRCACVERDTSKTKEDKTTRVMTSSVVRYGGFVVDDAPAPPGVAAALATRGGPVAANSSNVDDVDELETANAATGFPSRRRTMAKRMSLSLVSGPVFSPRNGPSRTPRRARRRRRVCASL
jgi:hypothetical protein